ncbi:MAG: hypothetical protein WD036_01905 [Bauldia sp.]
MPNVEQPFVFSVSDNGLRLEDKLKDRDTWQQADIGYFINNAPVFRVERIHERGFEKKPFDVRGG